MKIYNDDEIRAELEQISHAARPHKYSLREYPFNDLTDKEFEILLYLAFKSSGRQKVKFDGCHLVSGPGDKGRDVSLTRKGKVVGVVQCKKYKSALDKTQTAKEILKLALHIVQEPENYDVKNVSYYLAVSTGLNQEAQTLVEHFNQKIAKEKDFRKWLAELTQEYKSLKMDIDARMKEILRVVGSIGVELLAPVDIGMMIGGHAEIVSAFFQVEKVVDAKTFEDILQNARLDMDEFLKEYKKKVINNYSRINFFGLALPKRPREVSLEALFVKPTLKVRSVRGAEHFFNSHVRFVDNDIPILSAAGGIGKSLTTAQKLATRNDLVFSKILESVTLNESWAELAGIKPGKDQNIAYGRLFQSRKNVVLLGKPGAGKSSLGKYAICNILEKDTSVFANREVYGKIPFRIELHRYNKAKQSGGAGLTEYLSKLLHAEFQISFVSKNALDQLFKKYETIVFFDGMDEVLDEKERTEVRNDIENFSRSHDKAQCVVTSRFESYEEVYFDEKEFDVYEVNDFGDDQIRQYVRNWYGIEESDPDVRQKEIEACLTELAAMEEELKRNPLLLSLILILYRNEGELPTSKLDVYEGCTSTLVETRDKHEKKLESRLKVSSKAAVFASLAYWQNTLLNESSRKSITYAEALKQVKLYFLQKGEFAEEHDAALAAAEFLEFANIRSIYVENDFTHKTFMEYFTAYYLFSNLHLKGKFEERDRKISQYIGKSSWHVILELLICKIDKDQYDFELVDDLIRKQLDEPETHDDALMFFLTVVKYLQNVSPQMIGRLLDEAVAFCVENQGTKKHQAAKHMNGQLIALSKLERFEEKIKSSVDRYQTAHASAGELRKFAIFVLENSIRSEFLKLMSDEAKREELGQDPYLFILIHLPLIHDTGHFEEVLQRFIQRFTLKAVHQTYGARYGHRLFMGTSVFHWLITPLFAKDDFYRFNRIVRILTRNGVTYAGICKAIEESKVELPLSAGDLSDFLTHASGEGPISVLRQALQRYHGITSPQSENVPFYKKQEKSKRRFPVPR